MGCDILLSDEIKLVDHIHRFFFFACVELDGKYQKVAYTQSNYYTLKLLFHHTGHGHKNLQ